MSRILGDNDIHLFFQSFVFEKVSRNDIPLRWPWFERPGYWAMMEIPQSNYYASCNKVSDLSVEIGLASPGVLCCGGQIIIGGRNYLIIFLWV